MMSPVETRPPARSRPLLGLVRSGCLPLQSGSAQEYANLSRRDAGTRFSQDESGLPRPFSGRTCCRVVEIDGQPFSAEPLSPGQDAPGSNALTSKPRNRLRNAEASTLRPDWGSGGPG